MKTLQIIFFLASSYFVYAQDIGGDYYVAPPDHPETPGHDISGNGSYSAPWATFQRAFEMAQPGDTVYFRGGVYHSTEASVIDPESYPRPLGCSGTAENPICYFGHPNDVAADNLPILDCSLHCSSAPTNPYSDYYNSAISISKVQFIHFKDMEIRNVFQCDSVIDGAIAATLCANLTFEHIIVHNIGQRGYWIQGGAWGEYINDPPSPWEYDTTRWINCDTYDLCDTLVHNQGNAADAWKTVHYKGNYILWEGCRAWNYTDDGWDPTIINGAQREFKNCWVMAGDKYKDIDPYGDQVEKNGFKNNGLTDFPSVDYSTLVMTNCIAAFCERGFYELNYRHNGVYYNNTAYKCNIGFVAPFAEGDHPRTSTYRNNIAYGSTGLDPGLKQPYEVALLGNAYAESHNTWDWINDYPYFVLTDTVIVTDEDFVLIEPTAVFAQLTAKRKHDGSLPDITALNLTAGSDLIDAGTDVGLSYNGESPDIGALELGSQPGSGNQYPSVIITSPFSGSIFPNSSDITIEVDATDPDGTVSKVEFFYQETIKLGETNVYPWSFTWVNAPVGYHALKAVATDNHNTTATSSKVYVSITQDTNNLGTDNPGTDNPEGLLYPNPNNGIFTLFLPDSLQTTSDLRIISLEGKVMYRGTMLKEELIKEFDLSNINPGMYVLLLSSKESLIHHKFIRL